MQELEIWPQGDIDFGGGIVGGDKVVMIQFTDQTTGMKIRIGFQRHAFVTFADHVSMVSDSALAGDLFKQ